MFYTCVHYWRRTDNDVDVIQQCEYNVNTMWTQYDGYDSNKEQFVQCIVYVMQVLCTVSGIRIKGRGKEFG